MTDGNASARAGKFRVLFVPDSIYWVLGTIAKAMAEFNPWIEATIISGPLLDEMIAGDPGMMRRFDLVHFICPYASKKWLETFKKDLPVVTSHHHVTTWKSIEHNIDGDAIVAGSQEWVDDLKSRGADMDRVFRVPYGVDTAAFRPARPGQREAAQKKLGLEGAGPIVGFFAKKGSNDDDRKGTDVFNEAILALKDQLPNTGVLIVGPGWQDLVQQFRSKGIRCAWLPFVEDFRNIPGFYHALDFYWVTARVEGGPVPLLEAMSSEICSLSTPVGLALEVVDHGTNAMLLPKNDAAAFVNETMSLWEDPARRAAMGRAGRRTMLSVMRVDENTRLIRGVYEKAIVNHAQRNPLGRTVTMPSPSASGRRRDMADGEVPLDALNAAEKRRVEMHEALAWTEDLVLHQRQRGAATRLAMKAWARNPTSLEPPRILLRRMLPQSLVSRVVLLKKVVGGARQ